MLVSIRMQGDADDAAISSATAFNASGLGSEQTITSAFSATAAIQNLNYLDSLGQISGIPVLFIAGAQDAGTPPAGMEAMHANMAGSEYVLLDPAAHISNVERPDAFNKALTDFLGKH